MKTLLKFLVSLKLFDTDNTASITSIALYVVIFKIGTSPIDWTAATAFFIALLSYNGKKVFAHIRSAQQHKQSTDVSELVKEVEKSKDEITAYKKAALIKQGLSPKN